MILLLRTSAGEQTVVATVPCQVHIISIPPRQQKMDGRAYGGKTGSKVAIDIVLKVGGLQKFRLEEIISVYKVRDDHVWKEDAHEAS